MWTERGTARKRLPGYFLKLKQETSVLSDRVECGGGGEAGAQTWALQLSLLGRLHLRGTVQLFQELHRDPFCLLVKQEVSSQILWS